jgi:hypothetical protein
MIGDNLMTTSFGHGFTSHMASWELATKSHCVWETRAKLAGVRIRRGTSKLVCVDVHPATSIIHQSVAARNALLVSQSTIREQTHALKGVSRDTSMTTILAGAQNALPGYTKIMQAQNLASKRV